MESYAPNSSSLLSNDDLYRPHSHNHNHNANNNNTPGASANPTNHTGGGAGAGGGIPVGQSTFPGNRHVPPTNTVRRYPVVQCVAPEHLSEGYTFDVEVHHEILTITVPLGGVRKGQTFHGQTQAQIQDERTVVRIPVGGWKDSLLDFCTYGPFHPSLVMGACCPLVLLGQIYTRLSLNWHGRPIEQEYQQTSTTDDVNHATTTVLTPQFQYSSRAFKIMVALTIFFRIVLPQFDPYYDPSSNHVEEVVTNDPFMYYSTYIYFFICAILIARTRTYIRRRYEIQATVIEEMVERAPCACCRNLVSGLEDHESVPFGCDVVEDYLLSCCCAPCVVTQMSRHTAPYDTYDGSLCSSNGLPEHAPAMI